MKNILDFIIDKNLHSEDGCCLKKKKSFLINDLSLVVSLETNGDLIVIIIILLLCCTILVASVLCTGLLKLIFMKFQIDNTCTLILLSMYRCRLTLCYGSF